MDRLRSLGRSISRVVGANRAAAGTQARSAGGGALSRIIQGLGSLARGGSPSPGGLRSLAARLTKDDSRKLGRSRGAYTAPSTASTDASTAATAASDAAESLARSNAVFQQQVNAASGNRPSVLSDAGLSEGAALRYKDLQTNIFYASTKGIWRNVPVDRRNEAIMAYYGFDSLQDAFDYVMSQNADALAEAREWAEGHPVTETSEIAGERGDDSERQSTGVLPVLAAIKYAPYERG